MSRSLKKAPYVEEKLYSRICAMNANGEKKVLKTWSRSSTIFPEFVGHTIAVHDGKKHIPVYITEDTSSVSLRPPARSRVMPARKRPITATDCRGRFIS